MRRLVFVKTFLLGIISLLCVIGCQNQADQDIGKPAATMTSAQSNVEEGTDFRSISQTKLNRRPTTSERLFLESTFPNLNVNDIWVTDEQTTQYNYVPYLMRITRQWINPRSELTDFQRQYKNAKSWYAASYNCNVIPRFVYNANVDGWGKSLSNMTHGRVVYSGITWESKLGQYLRITHSRKGLSGNNYGDVLTSFEKTNRYYRGMKNVAQHSRMDNTPLSAQQLSKIRDLISLVDKQTQIAFEITFSNWKKEWLSSPQTIISSDTNDAKKLDSYINLKSMGKAIIPLVVGKLVEEDNFFALVLYDDLQQNENEKISYKQTVDKDWLFEGEQSRARRTVKLWLASQKG